MSIQRKISQYKGLTDIETFIEDSLPTSKYFKVFSLEDTIPGGRSTFQILGSEFLENNVEIKIELLDINGSPIYTEPIKYLGDDPSRHIMIEVYPDTPSGVGKLTILGVTTEDVPDDWKGLYNIKWEKEVFIDPNLKNTQPILFRGQGFDLTRNKNYPLPELDITETISGVVVASGSSGNEFVTSSIFSGGKYKGNASPFSSPINVRDLVNARDQESILGDDFESVFEGKGGGQAAKTTYAAKSKNQQNATDSTAIQTDVVNKKYEEFHEPQAEPTPSPLPKIPLVSSQPTETAPEVQTKLKKPEVVGKGTLIKRESGEPFRLELAGGTFKTEPKVSSLVEGVKGQKFVSSSFTASVVAVHSPDLLEIDTPFVIKDETPEQDDSNPFVAVPHESESFTIDFEPITTGSASDVILQSFANITIRNMKTFSGDVHRVKVFAKGFSTQGDFKLVADKLVEGSDVLVDTGSVSLSQKVGKFINQDHIDKNWEVKHIKRGPNSETPEIAGTATFTSSAQPPLMNAVLVSGSNSKVDESILFQTKTPKINIRPNVDYTLFVNAVVKTAKTDVLEDDGSILSNQSKAKVRFYLSGSNLGQDLKDVKPASSGSIGNILGDPVKVIQTDDETQGQVITLESNDNEVGKTIDFGRVKIPFKPQFSGSGITLNDDTTLQVEVEAGELFIQGVELQPSSDTNFNPDEFTFQIQMPKLRKRPDFFDFLVEFYDRNGNKAGFSTIKEAVEFDGENDVIQGTDNLLTGSLSIGNALGVGIEAAGVNSAYLRSVDYAGFDSASVSGQGGFLIFSGSVSRSLNTSESYDGVGLELHDGNSGSFKFRTKNADGVGEFDVRTNKFFFGKEGVQFVSGSDDKIEISSSNFHLQADGNLTIGGGAVINSSLSANSILVPAVASNPFEASASISSTGAARFTSASIGGFSVSETAISSSNGELVLKANGQITGSNFKLDGGTISSGVTIDAAVAANSLSLPAVGTKTAVITAQGEATFSKAQVADFKIDTQEIRALSGSLILSASGAITASDVLVTGTLNATSGSVFRDITSLHATSGALETDISSSISRSIGIEETTGSLITSASLVRLSLTSSKEESDLVAKGFGEKAVVSASAFAQGAEATASALAIGAESSASLQVTESLEFTREFTGSLHAFTSSQETTNTILITSASQAKQSASFAASGSQTKATEEFITSASLLKTNFASATASALTFALNANTSASAATASIKTQVTASDVEITASRAVFSGSLALNEVTIVSGGQAPQRFSGAPGGGSSGDVRRSLLDIFDLRPGSNVLSLRNDLTVSSQQATGNTTSFSFFIETCVLPGTKILIKRDDKEKQINIEDTKKDDLIYVFDFKTKEFNWSPIKEIKNRITQEGWSHIKTEKGYELKCSNSHLLYHPNYPNNAIATNELGIGGQLYVFEDNKIVEDKINFIQVYDELVEVWNYELEFTHNYISNGILSHNAVPKPFTAGHRYFSNKTENLEKGDLVRLNENNEIVKTTEQKDSSVLGIVWYEFCLDSFSVDGEAAEKDDKNLFRRDSMGRVYSDEQLKTKKLWKIASIGDTRFNYDTKPKQKLNGLKICNQNGEVKKGDLLCSSDIPGYAMKQPTEFIITSITYDGSPNNYEERQNMNSFTIGKSMQDVEFDENGKAEGIYGYLYCG